MIPFSTSSHARPHFIQSMGLFIDECRSQKVLTLQHLPADLRTFIAIAARFDPGLLRYDAVNAFVNARLEGDVFMKMLPRHRRNGMILKLNKPLYGLRRSPLLWQRVRGPLKKLGCWVLNRFRMNPAVLSRVESSWAFFYIDDISHCVPKASRSCKAI
jgi:hypothetical protein